MLMVAVKGMLHVLWKPEQYVCIICLAHTCLLYIYKNVGGACRRHVISFIETWQNMSFNGRFQGRVL